jgi:hypothetical protein
MDLKPAYQAVDDLVDVKAKAAVRKAVELLARTLKAAPVVSSISGGVKLSVTLPDGYILETCISSKAPAVVSDEPKDD